MLATLKSKKGLVVLGSLIILVIFGLVIACSNPATNDETNSKILNKNDDGSGKEDESVQGNGNTLRVESSATTKIILDGVETNVKISVYDGYELDPATVEKIGEILASGMDKNTTKELIDKEIKKLKNNQNLSQTDK